MIIDIVDDHINKPLPNNYRLCSYRILGWVTGRRVPIDLGTIQLPQEVNIAELIEVINKESK
jgi:hypothetical protein